MTDHRFVSVPQALGVLALCGTTLCGSALAADPGAIFQNGRGGILITPGSSIERAADLGVRAHTNVHILWPAGHATAGNVAPYGYFENPMSLACIYKLVAVVKGCNPQTLTAVTKGGSKVVAIVDAYHYPTAASDLAIFSKQYGLPAITAKNFQVVYGTVGGTQPPQDSTGGWELEESLDIEMAHALAPHARVILVEAGSNSYTNLLYAEQVASGLVSAAGGGEVSNSWGGAEFSGEEAYETTFEAGNVVFFASAGDSPGTGFPSVLQNVTGVGGTTVNRDSGTGDYESQSVWSSTGGGHSLYVPAPSYQAVISGIVGTMRGVPDVALVANPNTGVWIYDTTAYIGTVRDWLVVGGTSVASPATAAIVNNAKHFAVNSPAELTTVYANFGVKQNFTDITTGTCNNGSTELVGWDYCTGVGTPLGRVGK